jgi:mono/diheme cytochrome c family protein
MTRSGTLTLAAAALLLAPAAASAQMAPAQYTSAQAEAGKEIFARWCAVCHNPNLEGTDAAPPLSGEYFASSWGGRPAASLIAFVTENMPAVSPGSLDPESYLRVVAYILSFNGAPAGDTPLAAGDQGSVTVVAK